MGDSLLLGTCYQPEALNSSASSNPGSNGESIHQRERTEAALARELVGRLVVGAAGVISGIKPASLVNYVPHVLELYGTHPRAARAAERKALCCCARNLVRFGLRLIVLDRRGGRVVLFIYRPCALKQVLTDSKVCSLLTAVGYDIRSLDTVISTLRQRMANYYGAATHRAASFPHEVGLLLGYPAEDVRGFMAGNKEVCRGPWKAYGDVKTAQARFRCIAACERHCRERFAAGESFAELLAQPSAMHIPQSVL